MSNGYNEVAVKKQLKKRKKGEISKNENVNTNKM